MVDGHIHIERGEYTQKWVNQFVNKAVEKQLDEIWLLEHCYRFEEFWEHLTERLLGKGFSVCTNSAGDKEPPIKGTVAVACKL